MLLGRVTELARIDQLLADAQDGVASTLVLRGDPGVGKTALLRHAVERSDGMTLLRATGIEAEAEIEFSGLLEVCRPVVPAIDDLPEHQAAVLRAALGLSPAPAGDRFAVGAATLGLIGHAAETDPVLVLIDDAQWLDRASADALRFVARRLMADRVAFLFAARTDSSEPGPGGRFEAGGLEELVVGGLDQEGSAAVLAHVTGGTVPEEVVSALHAATAGNPLALIELPDQLSAAQLSGLEALEGPLPVGRGIERGFAGRLARLPEPTRNALLVLSLSTTDALEAPFRALQELEIPPEALEPAEDADLVAIELDRYEFRHPLLRAVVHQTASPSERRAAHRALATALTGYGEDERRAWHLAASAIGQDDEAADALALAAGSARGRGGSAAAAAAFERAGRLSTSPSVRVERLAEAAEAAWAGGLQSHARELLAESLPIADEARVRSRLLRLAGRIEFQEGSQRRALALFLEAAELVEDVDPTDAGVVLSFAVFACHNLGRITEAVELSERVEGLAERGGPPTALLADYLHGRSLLLAGRAPEGRPHLERYVETQLGQAEPKRHHLSSSGTALFALDRAPEALPLVSRVIEMARVEGPMVLAYGLSWAAAIGLRTGDWSAATAAADEGLSLTSEIGQQNVRADFLNTLIRIDAARGREEQCRARADEVMAVYTANEIRLPAEQVRSALGLLELGAGRLDAACAILIASSAAADEMGLCDRDVSPEIDLVESLVHLGRGTEARWHLDRWRARGTTDGTAWGPPLAARCEGLLAADDAYEAVFAEALALHLPGDDPFGEARTRLCFGVRLRRDGRRVDARVELRAAFETFERLETTPWSERARRELRATGEKLRRKTVAPGEALTPQELQIALRVAEGKTNRDVGAALYLSPKTIEFHLARVYRKLELGSRGELIRRFAEAGAPA